MSVIKKPNDTFREIANDWAAAKSRIVKYSSMCTYQLTLQTHLIPYFGDKRTITEQDVQRFVFEKLAAGLAKKTVHDTVAILRAVAKYGARRKRFAYEEWHIEFPTYGRAAKLQVLSLAHQRKLLRYLTNAPTPRNAGILLALCTGMRIGEVSALRWSDVDLPSRTITICRTAGNIYNCERRAAARWESTPKTANSQREIPIPAPLYQALKRLSKTASSPYVTHNNGRPLDPRSYRTFFYSILASLGIPRITFHGLRHTFATRCIESGCDYKAVSAILGHANISTTLNLYVHTTIQQKQQCMNRVTRFVNIEKEPPGATS